MGDTNRPGQSEFGDTSLDAFCDVEEDIPWSSEHTRSLGFLLGSFAIIVAIISLGLLLG